MKFIPIDQILVEDRQREKIDRKQLEELKGSIAEHSLMQPLVLVETGEPDNYRLVAGERRLRALTEMHKEKLQPQHGDLLIPEACVPATVMSERELFDLLSMEYDENARRVQLTWQEEARAIEAIHDARLATNPNHNQTDTAKALHESMSQKQGKQVTIGHAKNRVTEALMVARNLHRPDIQRAKSHSEAHKILLRESQERFTAELARRRLSRAQQAEKLWDLRQGDLRELMPTLDDQSVDLILVDPPYGQNLHKEKYAAGTFHRYDDSEEYALDICLFIIQEGWRVTKLKANMFMFCHLKQFYTLREAAQKMGWQVWANPLIWHKAANEGAAPWGRLGFCKTYEAILYATKGERGIKGPRSDVFTAENFGALHGSQKTHGAQKPVRLLAELIELSTYPNDVVLDPCAGSASTLFAARTKSRRSIGFELDETYFNRAITKLTEADEYHREHLAKETGIAKDQIAEEFGLDLDSDAELEVEDNG